MKLSIVSTPWGKVWPAKWVSCAEAGETPRVVAFRRRFTVAQATTVRIHVSADERYELFVNGARIGRGPERGDEWNWFFETYDLDLAEGLHVIVARTWWLGPKGPAPFAQISVRHAFLLAAGWAGKDDLLSTGIAAWECKLLDGYECLPAGQAWGCGAKVRIVGKCFDWGYERGDGETGWQSAVVVGNAVTAQANDQPACWRLRPAMLPAMAEETTHVGTARLVTDANGFPFHDDPYQPQPPVRAGDHFAAEACDWDGVLRGESPQGVTIPAHTVRRVLIDVGDYYCAYPDLRVSGGAGAMVRLSWAESLYERLPVAQRKEWIGNMPKGNRDEVEGKFFHGVTDEFLPDGGTDRAFSTLWWEAGRYVQLLVRTADQPLTVHDLSWRVTHYPFEFAYSFDCSDPCLVAVNRLAQRALTMGSHEHYTDSPYYEQLQYVGDTRLEVLTTYATCPDARLPRKAIELLGAGRSPDGRVLSRHPSRVIQHTWGFNLWWVAMVHDWMMWRGDKPFVAARLPGVRTAIDAALACVSADSLVRVPNGSNVNFMDWGVGWKGGHPPINSDISGLFTFQLAYVLGLAAELEDYTGEPEMAARWRRHARQIAAAATGLLWNEQRGLLADDPAKTHFTEHTQILALLSGLLPPGRRDRVAAGLCNDPGLDKATIYFSHYLFEVCHQLHQPNKMFDRLNTWFDLLTIGLRTLPEMPEPTRSDCHAWGAHVLYHCQATLLGVRPASPGFATVSVRPMLGPLSWASGTLPHPAGPLRVDLRSAENGLLQGSVDLPPGVRGTFAHGPGTQSLEPGHNPIRVPQV